jgi:hypothetical protein
MTLSGTTAGGYTPTCYSGSNYVLEETAPNYYVINNGICP